VKVLENGFGFINGIVWIRASGGGGHLLISDIPANVVYRWTSDGKMSSFLEKPDWTRTTGRPPNPRFGANGITIDPQGRVGSRRYLGVLSGRQTPGHNRST
jgi:sugar lactone lactonase YvrE